MKKQKLTKLFQKSLAVSLLVALSIVPTLAAQSSSNSYKVEEVYFGTGGELEACSGNQYCAQQSTGSLTTGTASSNNFDSSNGFLSAGEPFLEAAVMTATVDFGTLDPNAYSSGAAQAGACNCSFYVKTYRSSSYVVVTASQPPTTTGGDALDGKSSTSVPSNDPSVEEFGINVVANSSPNIGANPVNQPDNSFADGRAAGDGVGGLRDYDDPDNFAYGAGDTIARSQATTGNPAIGLTEYTISYIAKPSNLTPAGLYQMNHDLIFVATF